MTTRALSDMTLAKAKRFALIGALVLWVLCPVVIGGWITVAVHLAGGDHIGALAYAGMVVGAIVCLALVVAGFAFLLGGVFFWWRSSNPSTPRRDPARSAAREEILRQLHEQLRAESADGQMRADAVQDAGTSAAPSEADRVVTEARASDDSDAAGRPR